VLFSSPTNKTPNILRNIRKTLLAVSRLHFQLVTICNPRPSNSFAKITCELIEHKYLWSILNSFEALIQSQKNEKRPKITSGISRL